MILRHDRTDRDCVVKEGDWPQVTSFFNGYAGASLIAPRWLLTAAHVAEHVTPGRTSVELATARYQITRTVAHPTYDPAWVAEHEDEGEDALAAHPVVDLALVELETLVNDVVPFALYEDSDELGREVVLLGRGAFGDGLRGSRGFDRGLRQATNLIDEADTCWLKMRFDAPPNGTRLEGTSGEGDSGGPALIERDGRYLIAGVSSWTRLGGRTLGTYGTIDHYTRVSPHVAWIRETTSQEEASQHS